MRITDLFDTEFMFEMNLAKDFFEYLEYKECEECNNELRKELKYDLSITENDEEVYRRDLRIKEIKELRRNCARILEATKTMEISHELAFS